MTKHGLFIIRFF